MYIYQEGVVHFPQESWEHAGRVSVSWHLASPLTAGGIGGASSAAKSTSSKIGFFQFASAAILHGALDRELLIVTFCNGTFCRAFPAEAFSP
jgi:hypothetical protein